MVCPAVPSSESDRMATLQSVGATRFLIGSTLIVDSRSKLASLMPHWVKVHGLQVLKKGKQRGWAKPADVPAILSEHPKYQHELTAEDSADALVLSSRLNNARKNKNAK